MLYYVKQRPLDGARGISLLPGPSKGAYPASSLVPVCMLSHLRPLVKGGVFAFAGPKADLPWVSARRRPPGGPPLFVEPQFWSIPVFLVEM